jgi:aryl-alcohol dehydrogenase-like predicted oxidoreductase
MAQWNRRDFTRALAGAPLAHSALPAAGAMPVRRLGNINFHASILGLGAQHLGDNGVEQSTVDRVIGEGIDNGLNYIDTAPTYNLSEERVGRALKGKRDKVFLVSKVETMTRGDVMYQIRDSLRKLQTDHLDCVHLHNISRDDRYPDLKIALDRKIGALGALIDAKKQGMIRHIGCTSHLRPARALPAFETGEVELFMCTLNFVERHIYGFEEKVLPEARKRGIGVVAMKVLGGPVRGGARLMAPEDYQATLRYVWGLPGVAVVNLGIRTVEELRQALAAARSFKPLSREEMAALTARGKQMAAAWGPLRGPVA